MDGNGRIGRLLVILFLMEKRVMSAPMLKLLSYIEINPIIEIRKTAADLGVSFNTVSDAAKRLCEIGILKKTTNTKRNRTFAYEAYLEILRSGT